jgi:hypothetical protein
LKLGRSIPVLALDLEVLELGGLWLVAIQALFGNHFADQNHGVVLIVDGKIGLVR